MLNLKRIPKSFQIIIAIQVLIFILVQFDPTWVFKLALQRNMVVQFGEYYRIITGAFLHQDLFHIAMNLYATLTLLSVLVLVFNEKQLLLIYFVSLLGSSFAVISFTNSFTLGSSGAIFGLFGALTYVAYIEYERGNRRLLNSIIPVLVVNLLISFMPGISLYGHLGGFVFGLSMTYFIVQRRFLR